MSKDDTPKKYNKKYFDKPFPPNHNPIIGTHCLDTINNVHNALCFIRESHEAPDNESEEESRTGLFFLLTCLIQWLRFEMENRE